MEQVIIDAKGKTLGRVASEAAKLLAGKNLVSFARNKTPGTKVKVTNAKSLHIPEKKRLQKKYVRYTGYPGGLRNERLEEMIAKKGVAEPLREAIYGMLPSNKLRPRIMKNLSVEE
ncbi:MAG TPA: 50S ribosomal protein L13 [Candidatus Paceibacterota bacterium]